MKSLLKNYLPGQDNHFAGYVTKLLMLGVDISFAGLSFFVALLVTNNFAFAAAGVFFVGKTSVILLALRALSFFVFKTYLIIIRFVGGWHSNAATLINAWACRLCNVIASSDNTC